MTHWLSNQEVGQLISPNFIAPKRLTSQLLTTRAVLDLLALTIFFPILVALTTHLGQRTLFSAIRNQIHYNCDKSKVL